MILCRWNRSKLRQHPRFRQNHCSSPRRNYRRGTPGEVIPLARELPAVSTQVAGAPLRRLDSVALDSAALPVAPALFRNLVDQGPFRNLAGQEPCLTFAAPSQFQSLVVRAQSRILVVLTQSRIPAVQARRQIQDRELNSSPGVSLPAQMAAGLEERQKLVGGWAFQTHPASGKTATAWTRTRH